MSQQQQQQQQLVSLDNDCDHPALQDKAPAPAAGAATAASPDPAPPLALPPLLAWIPAWMRSQSAVSLTVKAAVTLALWHVLGVRQKVVFLARHPWMTLAAMAAAVQGYLLLKPRMPALKQRAVQTAMGLGMKAFGYGVQWVMSSMIKPPDAAAGPHPQFPAELRRCLDTQFAPMLPHVGAVVDDDAHVGNLVRRLAELKAVMRTATPRARVARMARMFRQAVASVVTKGLAFAHLFALEQFVLAVLLRSPHLGNAGAAGDGPSLTTSLEVCMKAVVEDYFLGEMLPQIAAGVKRATAVECRLLLGLREGGGWGSASHNDDSNNHDNNHGGNNHGKPGDGTKGGGGGDSDNGDDDDAATSDDGDDDDGPELPSTISREDCARLLTAVRRRFNRPDDNGVGGTHAAGKKRAKPQYGLRALLPASLAAAFTAFETALLPTGGVVVGGGGGGGCAGGASGAAGDEEEVAAAAAADQVHGGGGTDGACRADPAAAAFFHSFLASHSATSRTAAALDVVVAQHEAAAAEAVAAEAAAPPRQLPEEGKEEREQRGAGGEKEEAGVGGAGVGAAAADDSSSSDAAVVEAARAERRARPRASRRRQLTTAVARAWDLALSGPGRGIAAAVETAVSADVDALFLRQAFPAAPPGSGGAAAPDPKLLSVFVQALRFLGGLLSPDAAANRVFSGRLRVIVLPETARRLQTIECF